VTQSIELTDEEVEVLLDAGWNALEAEAITEARLRAASKKLEAVRRGDQPRGSVPGRSRPASVP
jgi:hypothetical protein